MSYLFIVLFGIMGQHMSISHSGSSLDTLINPITAIPLKSTIARIAPNTIVLVLKVDTVMGTGAMNVSSQSGPEREVRIYGTIEENLGRGMATISYPAKGQRISIYYEGSQSTPSVNSRIKVRVTEVYNSSDTRKAIYMTYFYRNLDLVN